MLWVSEGLWGIPCISLGRRENPTQVLDGNPAALGWATAASSRELVTEQSPRVTVGLAEEASQQWTNTLVLGFPQLPRSSASRRPGTV